MTPQEKAREYHKIISNNPSAEGWGFDAAYMEGYTEGYADAMNIERVPSKETINKIIDLYNKRISVDKISEYFYNNDSGISEEEPIDTIVLTKYFDDYSKSHDWFIGMLKHQKNYENYTTEQLEQVWQKHIKTEYSFDEIWDIVQCDGYTKIVFPMGRHDNQPQYDLVCETKEYIEFKMKNGK